MLDIALIRENPELVKKSMRDRQMSVENVDRLLELDKTRRELLGEAEALKAKRNSESKAIGKAKDPAERQERIAAMKGVSDRIAELDKQTKETEEDYLQHPEHSGREGPLWRQRRGEPGREGLR